MRVVIAPDKFKGSLSAAEAARAMSRGVASACPAQSIDRVPMADGGEGTVDALVAATGGSFREASVTGPRGEPVTARFGLLGDGRTAVIEMAAASGLVLVPAEERNPLAATTRGTGELLLAAIAAGAKRVIVGIGGSATNDGGAGLGQALGFRLLDAQERELEPGGGELGRLARIDPSGRRHELDGVEIAVACDVTNPLCGPDGASAVYGPQKGATPEMVEALDRNLAHFAVDRRARPGRRDQGPAGLGCRRRTRRRPGRVRRRQALAGHRARHRGRQSRAASQERRPVPDRRRGDRRPERLRQDGRRRRPAGSLAAAARSWPWPARSAPGAEPSSTRESTRISRSAPARSSSRTRSSKRRSCSSTRPSRPCGGFWRGNRHEGHFDERNGECLRPSRLGLRPSRS